MVACASAPTHQLPHSALDTLFARLDERAGELSDSRWDGEPGDEQAREGEADEDRLDLWSVLHGLE